MTERLKGTYVRGVALAGFAELVARRGGDPIAIVNQVGIDPAALSDNECLISWGALGAAFELAARQVEEPDFGLELGLAQPSVFPSAIPLVLLAREGQTMLDWLLASATQWRFYTNGYSVTLLPAENGGVIIRLEFPNHAFAPRHVIEASFATICRLWRSLGQHGDNPVAVRLRHGRPASVTRHAHLFGNGVDFDQDDYDIEFSAEQVRATQRPDPNSRRALVDWLVRRGIETDAGYDQSMSQTVALVISSTLGAGLCNMDFVAASLSLNPKKLQRLLAREKTSFSELLDNVRARLALNLLTSTDVGIRQLAGLMDYADTAPFSLAVRRWYGMSPVALRHRHAQDDLEGRHQALVSPSLTAG